MKIADLLFDLEPQAQADDREISLGRRDDAEPTPESVHEIFRRQAIATPNALAVSSSGRSLTYGELDLESDRLAGLLRASGVKDEDFVLLVMNRSVNVVIAMLAVLKAGCAYVPVLPSDPLERLHYVARDTRARIVIAESDVCEIATAVRTAMPGDARVLLFHSGAEHGEAARNGIKPGGDGSGTATWLTPAVLRRFSSPLLRAESPLSLAYCIYTSGTSGRPKGVMVAHGGIVRLVIGPGYMQIGPGDRFLQAGSLAFDAATFEIWGALLNGASVHISPREAILHPAAMREVLRREGITVLFLTTVLFNQMGDFSDDIFGGIRVLLTGGERVSAGHMMRVRKKYPEMELLHVYGPTENTTFTTAFPVRCECDSDVPIGSAIARTTISISGADLSARPAGTIGELCTGGDGLARGYLNDPALTAEKFTPDPVGAGGRVYRTGDLARWSREYGEKPVVEFCGRVDDQVKIRGFRIEPGEIEARLREVHGVRDAVIVVQTGPGDGKSLVAYLAGDGALDLKNVQAACKEALPDYMTPSHFMVLDQFPLNANGKVDREALPPAERTKKSVENEIGRSSQGGDPESTIAQLKAIWAEVLGRSDFAETDDFFDLGGHSLTAIQVVSLVEQRLSVELPITVIFDAPTLQEMARYILDTARFGFAALDDGMVLMGGDPRHGAVFAFPPGTADCLGYSDLAKAMAPRAFYGFTFLEADDRITRYADLIQGAGGTDKCVLFGYSSGGNLAYHVTDELESRGHIVGSVIMLDSARHLAELKISDEKISQVANDFLSSDDARKYLTSGVLRDKAFRNIARNLQYISGCLDLHVIKAPIHLIGSDNSEEVSLGDSGEIVVSKPAWQTASRGGLVRHQGFGDHDYMLHPEHFERNAALIRSIVEGRAEQAEMPVDLQDPCESADLDGAETNDLAVFDRLESRVRSYCRSFPTIFQKAQGALLYDRAGKAYIDFFSGAGALNYGHNPPAIKRALLDYLETDGVVHALDMATEAKERFLQEFAGAILRPRQLDYRVQFVGPTGTNGIEAALKLVRKMKRRSGVVAFTNSYHGLSGGSLAATANTFYRGEFYTQRANVAFMPFDGYMGPGIDTLDYFEKCLCDRGSGLDAPAAVIVETIQAEGGINVARSEWLQRLEKLCRRFDMLLIIDDIQVGCGRTGTFFSFERAGLSPDLVVLSKSISGYGLPMSLVLLKPELDGWEVGEHSGTFRGNNMAFVTATAALKMWRTGEIEAGVAERALIVREELTAITRDYPQLKASVRGLGLIFGLEIQGPDAAQKITRECFARGLILEICGPLRNVLKLLPPLVIPTDLLREGIRRIRDSIEAVLKGAA